VKRRAFLALPAVAAAGALRREAPVWTAAAWARLNAEHGQPIYSVTITKPDIDAFAAQIDRAWGEAMRRRSPWQDYLDTT
jgi:hypothetical protein